jgi:hypothetical protein
MILQAYSWLTSTSTNLVALGVSIAFENFRVDRPTKERSIPALSYL